MVSTRLKGCAIYCVIFNILKTYCTNRKLLCSLFPRLGNVSVEPSSGRLSLIMVDKQVEKQFILEFIEVYRGLPALWDVNCKDYSNRVKKREQYDVLIEKYREKYPYAGKQEVVKKINSLRTNFRKELKRIRDAVESGLEDVVPSLWYFEEMRFLQTQRTRPSSISMMDISEDIIDVVVDDEDRGNVNEISSHIANVEPCQKNRKRKAPEELVLASQCIQQPQDDIDKITAAWAVELRKMDPQQQLFAKKAISDILFEGQMGTLHRNSVEINISREFTK